MHSINGMLALECIRYIAFFSSSLYLLFFLPLFPPSYHVLFFPIIFLTLILALVVGLKENADFYHRSSHPLWWFACDLCVAPDLFLAWPLPRISNLYISLPNIAPWSLHWHRKHNTSETEATTLSFPKPWLICFFYGLMPLPTTLSFEPEAWHPCTSPSVQILERFALPNFSFSVQAPFSLFSIPAVIQSLGHLCHLRHCSLLCGVTLDNLACIPFGEFCKNPSFTLLLVSIQWLCPSHRVKASLPSLATMTLVQISDSSFCTLVVLMYMVSCVHHAIVFFLEYAYLLSHQNNFIFIYSGSSF